MSFAVYDLHYCPESFDFLTFFCAAKSHDKDCEIVFVEGQRGQNKKFGEKERLQRFHNILIDTCEAFGSRYRVVKSWNGECIFPANYPKAGPVETYFMNVLFDFYRKNGWIYKFSLNQKTQNDKYITITIRDSKRNDYRNSNIREWRVVRDRIGKTNEVIWIDDYFVKPISILDRFKLYESARMNLFVGNGPASFGLLSDVPYLIFKMITRGAASKQHLEFIGLPEGSQYPWRNENQKLVWEKDDANVILKHFNEWCSGNNNEK